MVENNRLGVNKGVNPLRDDERCRLILGDCLEKLKELPDNSVDAVITDPPYGLEFMGKEWDAPWKDGKASKEFNTSCAGKLGGFKQLPNHSRVNNLKCLSCGKWKFSSNPCVCQTPVFPNARLESMKKFNEFNHSWATETLRVLKPGGHLLAFGGTRTYHRLVCGIEDAGFEIRDCVMWIYGSGFPKSLNISKAIDKMKGVEFDSKPAEGVGFMKPDSEDWHQTKNMLTRKGETTPEAKQWDGWGTALKPAVEPIVLARKPLSENTVAENFLKHGTGGLNIDACRIGTESISVHNAPRGTFAGGGVGRGSDTNSYRNHKGRFPANLILDEEAAKELDKQAPAVGNVYCGERKKDTTSGTGFTLTGAEKKAGDSAGIYDGLGGASRFFYVAKASRSEREEGLGNITEQEVFRAGHGNQETDDVSKRFITKMKNHHPTVKPVKLMEYLIKLITPQNGVVLLH